MDQVSSDVAVRDKIDLMLDTLKVKVRNKVWAYVKNYFYEQRLLDTALIQNLNYSLASTQKKAVICYLTFSHFYDLDSNNPGRTQPYEILSIVRVFSELGYAVDIIGCNDTKSLQLLKSKKYDLIFGFGDTFYQLACLHPDAISVLYMTEHHPEFSFREEKKRLEYFKQRYGKKPQSMRSGLYYKLQHLQKTYSHVITMGEVEPFKNQYAKPYTIFPTGIINPGFRYENKNHSLCRKNFLWLGSTGAIHKGLDLLLDVFAERDDLVLHIAGLSNKDKKILPLPKKSNIVDHGYLDVKSDAFLQLAQTCSYNILPSCSEGFSTSISTGMLHGLIPIVMKDTGFNRIEKHAILLDDFKVDYLKYRLAGLAEADESWLEEFSKEVMKFANANFSICSFEQSFKEILTDILTSHD